MEGEGKVHLGSLLITLIYYLQSPPYHFIIHVVQYTIYISLRFLTAYVSSCSLMVFAKKGVLNGLYFKCIICFMNIKMDVYISLSCLHGSIWQEDWRFEWQRTRFLKWALPNWDIPSEGYLERALRGIHFPPSPNMDDQNEQYKVWRWYVWSLKLFVSLLFLVPLKSTCLKLITSYLSLARLCFFRYAL